MMQSFTAMPSARDIARAVAAGELTATDVTRAALDRIAASDGQIRAFTDVFPARALATAQAIYAHRSRGLPLPPLAGVPYAVKNLFDVEGQRTLAGAHIESDSAPALADAALVQRMDAAGAVLVGALNMDEYAYGFSTENTHFGPTHNPHDLARSAGGSSGGCAAAVAAGLVPLTLGSDTNGSIRVPSSLCGTFGLKPTFGRLPRTGSYPFVYSLDHLGPFARSVGDLALCYDALQGPDPADRHCAQRPPEPSVPGLAGPLPRLRVGILGGYFERYSGPDARWAVGQAATVLEARTQVTVALAEAGRAAAFVTTGCEGGQLHLEHLRLRYDDMEPLSRDRLLAGALMPASWYQRAQRVRALYRAEFLQLFRDYDVLITAATPVVAPELGTEWMELDGQRLSSRASMGLLTQPISCIGLPVVAAPLMTPGGLPIAVQLIAPPWREDLALIAAAWLEQAGVTLRQPV